MNKNQLRKARRKLWLVVKQIISDSLKDNKEVIYYPMKYPCIKFICAHGVFVIPMYKLSIAAPTQLTLSAYPYAQRLLSLKHMSDAVQREKEYASIDEHVDAAKLFGKKLHLNVRRVFSDHVWHLK